ncbi:MAG: hypothetical protein WCR92_07490 [Candidatus Cloacimonadaceae bacterium]
MNRFAKLAATAAILATVNDPHSSIPAGAGRQEFYKVQAFTE